MQIRTMQKAVIDALEEIKARDIEVFNVARMTSMFDRVIVASADSTRQVKAIARNVKDKLSGKGVTIVGSEGEEQGEWVLIDLGYIVVHIMQPAVRTYYNLEELWGTKPTRKRKVKKVVKNYSLHGSSL